MSIKAGLKAGALVLQAAALHRVNIRLSHTGRAEENQDAVSELHTHRFTTTDFNQRVAW